MATYWIRITTSYQPKSQSFLGAYKIKKYILVEKIKYVIFEMVHSSADPLKINFSDHLSKKLDFDYTYLANMFIETEGTTIEKYIIKQKSKGVNELIRMSEISREWNDK